MTSTDLDRVLPNPGSEDNGIYPVHNRNVLTNVFLDTVDEDIVSQLSTLVTSLAG